MSLGTNDLSKNRRDLTCLKPVKPPTENHWGQWLFSGESHCLQSHELMHLTREAKRMNQPPLVRDIAYLSWILPAHKFQAIALDRKRVLVDIQTGQLYGLNGVCMSNNAMRLV